MRGLITQEQLQLKTMVLEVQTNFRRTVRGMLPYQKNSSGRNSLRDLRAMIGPPSNLSGEELPDGHHWGDTSNIEKPLPLKFVRLGDISEALGIDSTRWSAE